MESHCQTCGASIEEGTCSNEMCNRYRLPIGPPRTDVEYEDDVRQTRYQWWTFIGATLIVISNLAIGAGRLVEGSLSIWGMVAYGIIILLFALIALRAYGQLKRPSAFGARSTLWDIHRERFVRGAYIGAVASLVPTALFAIATLVASGPAAGSEMMQTVLFGFVGIVLSAMLICGLIWWFFGLVRDLY